MAYDGFSSSSSFASTLSFNLFLYFLLFIIYTQQPPLYSYLPILSVHIPPTQAYSLKLMLSFTNYQTAFTELKLENPKKEKKKKKKERKKKRKNAYFKSVGRQWLFWMKPFIFMYIVKKTQSKWKRSRSNLEITTHTLFLSLTWTLI